jgi:hypothetical protein
MPMAAAAAACSASSALDGFLDSLMSWRAEHSVYDTCHRVQCIVHAVDLQSAVVVALAAQTSP